jgi:hypothetical protein
LKSLCTVYILPIVALAACALLYPGTGHYEAGLNFFAFFLALFYRSASRTDLTGRELSFFQYRCDNSLGLVFPVKGMVMKKLILSGEDDWLLVKLNQAFNYQAMTIEHVLIKKNDKKSLIPGKENQLVFFKLVPDLNVIREKDNDKADFPLEVWALCK